MHHAQPPKPFAPEAPIGQVGHGDLVIASHHHGFDRAGAAQQHPHLAGDVERRVEEIFRQFRTDQEVRRDAALEETVDSLELGGLQTREIA